MRKRTRSLTLIAIFTALISLFSVWQIPLPSPVPLTLQTFAVALCGYMLAPLRGGCAVLCYIFLGIAGLPVFSGFRGGISALLDFGGGFILGFLPLCLLCAVGANRRPFFAFLSGALGLALCHFCGSLYYSLLAHTSLSSAFVLVSLPFILKDLALLAAALAFSRTAGRRIAKITRL